MHEEVDHDKDLSVMVDRYYRLLDTNALTDDEITPEIVLCCSGFPFNGNLVYTSCPVFIGRFRLQSACSLDALQRIPHFLIGWHNVELIAARSQHLRILYVGVASVRWSEHTSYRLLGVSTP